MLAARGVSLGLGRINLSDLNQLPKADRALLGKLKREQKAEQRAQQAKLVVRKHVDSKTLLTACATVIVGAAFMAMGLLMTVVGYFDSDLFSSAEPLLVAATSTNAGGASDQSSTASINSPPMPSGKTAATPTAAEDLSSEPAPLGWFRLLLKSMQYVGPVLMGIGMFLLIIACVITLESRDRHAQIGHYFEYDYISPFYAKIIQEESTELRRSRRQTIQRTRSDRSRTGCGAEGETEGGGGADEMVRENGAAGGKGTSSPNVDEQCQPTASTNTSKQLALVEVHGGGGQSAPAFLTPNCTTADLSLISDASSTDVMAEYTFPCKRAPIEGAKREKTEVQGEELLKVPGKKGKKEEAEKKQQIEHQKQPAEQLWWPQQRTSPLKATTASRRKSSSAAIVRINRPTPRGPAPLVRVESLVELSISGSSPPPSTFGTPRRKTQL